MLAYVPRMMIFQVADFLQDGEIQTRAELISERLRGHMVAPTKQKSRFSRFMTSIGTTVRPKKPASRFQDEHTGANSSQHDDQVVPTDVTEDLLKAIEQLPMHLMQLVLQPFSLVSILRLPTDTHHPKLVMALQARISGRSGHQLLPETSSLTEMSLSLIHI